MTRFYDTGMTRQTIQAGAFVIMNIVHITSTLDDGGTESVLYGLCTHDTSNRHIVVCLRGKGKYGRLLQESGIPVHCLDMTPTKQVIGAMEYLAKLLRANHPDVVQTWLYHADLAGGIIARGLGIRKVCWNVRNSRLAPSRSRFRTRLIARICALLSHVIPDTIITCSHRARRDHCRQGYRPKKWNVIPNGFDTEVMQPDSYARTRLRKQWGFGKDVFLVGMVARFDSHKDHDNLLKALAILKQTRPEWICLLAGHGMTADNPELASLIRTLGLEHDVLLKGERHDIPDLMNALDIHVLSSVSEGFPNVIAEAMACGTPCVATDAGDASLIVGTTGWIVPPRNPIKLAHALEVAMLARDTPNAWKKRQVACRQRIEKKFPITGMVTAYNRAWAL